MKKIALLLFTCSVLLVIITGSKCLKTTKTNFTVGFYNVENLFDTIDDPTKNDADFLPNGKKQWTAERYAIKINNLTKVITALGNNGPDVLGLCEVENKEVVLDLVNSTNLKKLKYKVIHYNSPDARGIDVAAIYKESKFRLLHSNHFPVNFKDNPTKKTREILYVKGIVGTKDTLHIFFNHWPSRRGGQEKSEVNRIAAATVLRGKIDSLQKLNSAVKIIIMGDFNDYPNNKSLTEIVKADSINNCEKGNLFNLMYSKHKNGEGTYYYKGDWGVLDNIIVSSSLLCSKAAKKHTKAFIYKEDWILYENKSGVKSPSRSYSGPNFHKEGFSDHLPVYLELKIK